MTTKKKKLLWTITFLAIAGLLIVISPLGKLLLSNDNIYDYEEDKLKFDKKLWTINWDKYENSENDRHYMLNDLTKNYLTLGMDSIEIKELLGEPERDFGFSYNLGLYRSGFDPTFLILDFDNKGKLKEVSVETI